MNSTNQPLQAGDWQQGERLKGQRSEEEFTTDEVIKCLRDWLDYGETSLNQKGGHMGYFSGYGWAATVLRHLHQLLKSGGAFRGSLGGDCVIEDHEGLPIAYAASPNAAAGLVRIHNARMAEARQNASKVQTIASSDVATLRQLMTATKDGDLISKETRDLLVKQGYVWRVNGFNIITTKGIALLDRHRLI